MKINSLLLSVFVLAAAFFGAGCSTAGKSGNASEQDVDAELAKAVPAADAPEAGPGEPQRLFQQEPLQSQNL